MPTSPLRALSARGLEYRELRPDPSLAEDVECVWTLRADGPLPAPIAQITPCKAGLDLIIPFEGHFCQAAELQLFGASGRGAYVVGALSQPRTVLTAGRCSAAGVRFRPGRGRGLLPLPTGELTDRVVALSSVDARFEQRLADVAHEPEDGARRVRAVERAVRERLARTTSSAGREAVAAALRLIDRHHGDVTVEALAAETGSSVRQLERGFREVVGLSPKRASRIARVRHALTLLPLPGGATWSDVVFACGFYDQAHLIREFRALAGMTPGQLAGRCAAPDDARAGVSDPSNPAGARGCTVGDV